MKYPLFGVLLIVVLFSFSCNRKSQEITNNSIVISPGDNIQIHLDRLRANQELVLLPGDYIIDKPLLLTNKHNFVLRGENAVTIKMKKGVSKKGGGMFIVRDCSAFRISNFDLDANTSQRTIVNNQFPAHSLRLLGVVDFYVDSINFISSIQDAITVQQTNTFPLDGMISKCTFQDYWRSGISIINGSNIIIKECKFDKGLETAIGGGVNIEENDWNKESNRDIEIWNCEFRNSLYGIQLSSKGLGSSDVSISNCYFSNNIISVYNSFANTEIDSCTFENNVSEFKKSNAIRNACHISTDKVEMRITNSTFIGNDCEAIIYSDRKSKALNIDNCEFLDNKGYTISYYGESLKINNSIFSSSDRDVISSFNRKAELIITNNDISNVGRRALYVKDAQSFTFSNNSLGGLDVSEFYIGKLINVVQIDLQDNGKNDMGRSSKIREYFSIDN